MTSPGSDYRYEPTDPYRPRRHLTPPQGRLNDPNGCYFDGENIHVYYQHDPNWPYLPKRTGWAHTTTPVTGPTQWHHFPDALYPSADYDDRGCYSGSAYLDEENRLELFYTGNAKPGGQRRATQNLVTVSGRGEATGGTHLRSPLNPLIDGPMPGFTHDYRDPFIFQRTPGEWLMLLGAQKDSPQADTGWAGTGSVVLYSSTDRRNWQALGEIEFDTANARHGSAPDLIPGGYMWECPNILQLVDEADGQTYDVLIVLPQGVPAQTDADGTLHYASAHNNGYIVGHLEGTTFTVVRGFTELDYGHEFYAPQAVHNYQPTLIGWSGLPDQDDQPTKEYGWMHCMTALRSLRLVAGRLIQYPLLDEESLVTPAPLGVGETLTLRRRNAQGASGGELEVVAAGSVAGSGAGAGADEVLFSISNTGTHLVLERHGSYDNGDPRKRVIQLASHGLTPGAAIPLALDLDASILEVYVAGGAIAATSRIFD